jgi:hypothetical protein
MLRVTEALYGSLGSPVHIDCHSETTEKRQSMHLADKGPVSYCYYEVQCGKPDLCRVRIKALCAELEHQINWNSEDFELFPDILLGHILAETLYQ